MMTGVRLCAALVALALACASPAPPGPAASPEGGSDRLAHALAELSQSVEEAMSLIESSRFHGSDQERAEGARRVLRQLVRGIVSEVGAGGSEHPGFFRGTDRFLKAGLDNPDNHYLWARVSPDAEYRIEGTRGTTADFVIQVYRSMPGFPGWAGRYTTGGFFDSQSLKMRDDGSFEVMLGGDSPHGENWLPLHEDAHVLMIRYSFNDWVKERPGDVRIERVGSRGTPGDVIDTEALAERIENAAFFVVDGTRRYLEVTEMLVDRVPANALPPLYFSADGGVPTQVSANGHFDLAPDEALIVTTQPSDAPYQGIQLGNLWFESLDYENRLTSFTTAQARLSSDGHYHFVVSSSDPGVPNWLDSAGHRRGMLLLRWQGVGELPKSHQPKTRVVKLSDLRKHLPSDEPLYGPSKRAQQLSRRQDEYHARIPW